MKRQWNCVSVTGQAKAKGAFLLMGVQTCLTTTRLSDMWTHCDINKIQQNYDTLHYTYKALKSAWWHQSSTMFFKTHWNYLCRKRGISYKDFEQELPRVQFLFKILLKKFNIDISKKKLFCSISKYCNSNIWKLPLWVLIFWIENGTHLIPHYFCMFS